VALKRDLRNWEKEQKKPLQKEEKKERNDLSISSNRDMGSKGGREKEGSIMKTTTVSFRDGRYQGAFPWNLQKKRKILSTPAKRGRPPTHEEEKKDNIREGARRGEGGKKGKRIFYQE